MPRFLRYAALMLYCIVIWCILDVLYSTYLYVGETQVRRRDPQYHHGLLANIAGEVSWGSARYPFFTNSLGFRDAAVRDVPLKSDAHRVILIGDSFTEGVGVPFEQSFPGLLFQAGQARADKVEFLDAGAVSYSPVLYFNKVKSLIERGLQFDEVVVLVDISDVQDEATTYFCFDDDPRYRAFCNEAAELGTGAPQPQSSRTRVHDMLQAHFVMTDRLRYLAEHGLRGWYGSYRRRVLDRLQRSAWTIAGFDVGDSYAPLGVEGGITRALQNMQRLADLLAARGIPLTVAVYPWPMQVAHDDRDSRHVAIWREFCARNCKDFIDAFPAFFAVKDADSGWYERLFIAGDLHFSAAGNRLMFDALAKHLLPDRPLAAPATAAQHP